MKEKGLSLEQELINSFERWNNIFKYGCRDPFWADGTNLNLVRNHILDYKKQLAVANQFPEIYYIDTPPEVENSYIARSDEILLNAKRSLELYKNNEDYHYLVCNIYRLNKKQIKELSCINVLNYVNGLQESIQSGDYVKMRKHEDPKSYIESFKNCREKVEVILKDITYNFECNKNQLPGQLSIFDIEWEDDMEIEV
jgi:hypothetical protein